MSESVICLLPRVSLCTSGRRAGRGWVRAREACPTGGQDASLLPNLHSYLNLFLYLQQRNAYLQHTVCVLKMVYLTKT